MKTPLWGMILSSLALVFTRLIGTFTVRPEMGVSSLPLIPTSGDTAAATLAVATAIKPTGTVGQTVVDLLNAKNTTDDRKVVVIAATPSTPARILMFPASAVDSTVLAGETLVATVNRLDTTKESSAHEPNPEAGLEADPVEVALEAIFEPVSPKRGLASLVNAILDGLADDEATDDAAVAIVFDQTGTGTVKVYKGASAGTLTGKLADITQEAAETTTANPLW